jgi:hypothetical protein
MNNTDSTFSVSPLTLGKHCFCADCTSFM